MIVEVHRRQRKRTQVDTEVAPHHHEGRVRGSSQQVHVQVVEYFGQRKPGVRDVHAHKHSGADLG